jgi:hypothetical protein
MLLVASTYVSKIVSYTERNKEDLEENVEAQAYGTHNVKSPCSVL